LAQYLSVKNKLISGDEDITFLGGQNGWFCIRRENWKTYNYLVLDTVIYLWKFLLVKNSEYVNLGDWITYFTYGVFDGKTSRLKNTRSNLLG
jgi:UDP-2,3-diacylglucosamine hydrolase